MAAIALPHSRAMRVRNNKAPARRTFLKKSLSLSALGLLGLEPLVALAKIATNTTTGIYIGGGRYKEATDGPLKFTLSRVTTHTDGSNSVETLSSPIFPHGFAVDPNDEHRLIAFSKIGPNAAVYDLQSWQVIKKLTAQQNRLFYGHGVFSKDGKLLYSTETDIKNSQGYIGIRDANTLQYLGDFPSYGNHPHDCKLVDNGKTLVVTNGGGNSASGHLGNLSYIDIKTQKLIKQHQIEDGRFNAGHVQLNKSGDALVMSAPRRGLTKKEIGAIHVSKARGELKRLEKPLKIANKIKGEALSGLVIAKHNLLLVTHPTPGMVTCWDLNTLQCRKVIDLPHARGLALNNNESEFVVSFGRKIAVKRYKTTNLKEVENSMVENTGISGSHLINWQTSQKGLM